MRLSVENCFQSMSQTTYSTLKQLQEQLLPNNVFYVATYQVVSVIVACCFLPRSNVSFFICVVMNHELNPESKRILPFAKQNEQLMFNRNNFSIFIVHDYYCRTTTTYYRMASNLLDKRIDMQKYCLISNKYQLFSVA